MLTKVQQQKFYEKVGDNLKAARETSNIKQESLANALGLNRISISNIEKGKQRIQLHALIQASNYLKVNLSELLPTMEFILGEIPTRLEKKISNTEVANDALAIEKIKDFIKLSTSTSSNDVNR